MEEEVEEVVEEVGWAVGCHKVTGRSRRRVRRR